MATLPAELYDFSNDTGIVIPDTDDVRSKIVTSIKGVFGPNVDTSEETHIGRFVDELTEIVVQTTGVNAQNANQFNLNYATGTFLDNLGAAFGIPRMKGSHTKVKVKLACSAGITVPRGTIFATNDGYEFTLDADVEVTESGEAPYFGEGTATAVLEGRVYCPPGSLNSVKTIVLGLLGVSNTSEGNVGRDLETDQRYRSRIKSARESGAASCGAILNALYSLKDDDTGAPLVSDAIVLENGHAYPVVKLGVTLPPHSVFVCVAGDDGTVATEQKIARAIYETKTAGADYTRKTAFGELLANLKDVEVEDKVSSVASTVSFFRPVMRGLTVRVRMNTSNYTGTDAQGAVVTAIKEYLSDAGIGAGVTGESLVSYIVSIVANTLVITDLKLEYDGNEVEGVSLSAGEAFTTDTRGVGARLVVEIVEP